MTRRKRKTVVSEKLKELRGQIQAFYVDVFTKNNGSRAMGLTEYVKG